jgi:CHAD domain-containing protein
MSQSHNKTAHEVQPPDVLKHLADSLATGWKRYRKRLRCCQRSFSEEAVHDSRVETRRLISTIDLIGAFIPERELDQARRALKRHLDTFDKLRDTQVQLVYVGRMMDTYPGAREFRDWLRKRETRFTRQTRKSVKAVKTKRLGRSIAAFEKEIRRRRKETPRERAFNLVQQTMNRAFDRVARLCSRVDAHNTETIHRTRVAFKRFRYMVESLSPLLPVVKEQHRQAMRGYQSMMGDIQDVEVLLEALGKFVRKKNIDARSARRLGNELQRRRGWLIRVYLSAAGRLRQFWPLPVLVKN